MVALPKITTPPILIMLAKSYFQWRALADPIKPPYWRSGIAGRSLLRGIIPRVIFSIHTKL